jgi:hypothetical protein
VGAEDTGFAAKTKAEDFFRTRNIPRGRKKHELMR